jgi:thymidylate synthase ThyX
MQASAELTGDMLAVAKVEWLEAAKSACNHAEALMDMGIHKQVGNRLLEPFIRVDTVITGTEWGNFYELRDHDDAQPEIRDLAKTMRMAYSVSKPRHLQDRSLKDPRGWHLPFVTMEERKDGLAADLIAMSAARCARTSYQNHNKENPTLKEDDGLYRRLVESRPLHASPLEHQAVASSSNVRHSNFLGGWIPHRNLLEHAGSIDELRRIMMSGE